MKLGLVLAGGGAKGAYEVGVYQALKELELIEAIKVISGTSIGSINALLFAMDNPKVIQESWSSLNYSDFLISQERKKITDLPQLVGKIKNISIEGGMFDQSKLSDLGIMSRIGIENFIDKYTDMGSIESCGKEIYANAYNIDEERCEYFRLNGCTEQEIKDRVLASCSVPHMFKPVVINGMRYADGGISSPLYSKSNIDNVPMLPLREYELDGIIVVHLSYKNKIHRTGFEGTKIIEIYPSAPLAMINGVGTINISKSTIQNNIELGYRDAMVILAPMVIQLLKGNSIDELIRKNDEANRKYI